nr:putative RNA-dependent RNA polymerase [Rhizoctonia solani mitovirus 110]
MLRNKFLTPTAMRLKAMIRLRISAAVVITKDKLNRTFGVKAMGLLVGCIRRMLPAVGLRTTSPRVHAIVIFVSRCKSIYKAQGIKGLVLTLKALTVLTQQALSGMKLADALSVGARVGRNKSGLPSWILVQDRAKIRQDDFRVMRFYLTLFNLYRILEFPGKLKLGTITDPSTAPKKLGNVRTLVISFLPAFILALNKLTQINPREALLSRRVRPFIINKSAPGVSGTDVSASPMSFLTSARALYRGNLAMVVEYFIKRFSLTNPQYGSRLVNLLTRCVHLPIPPGALAYAGSLGKLGFKHEPAGKERAFAMVDPWTQWSLRPIHDTLFKILKRVPQDGTHNQLAPLANAKRWSSLWSLDLTAATDRLPLSLQKDLLQGLFTIFDFGQNWAELLVNRDYFYHWKPAVKGSAESQSGTLRYAVGQPMGALSSWASLAITHHFLVQAASWHSGIVPAGTWYQKYAIVGDDLVIGDKAVKDSYLLILEAFGMPVNQSKSILSPKGIGLEFCKRTIIKGVDVSPVPFMEFIAANLTLPEAVAYGKKYSLTFPQLIKTLGYGYKVLGGLHRHVGSLNSRVRALLFTFILPLRTEDAASFDAMGAILSKGNPSVGVEQLKAVATEFALVIKFKISGFLQKDARHRRDIKSLVQKELDSFMKRFVDSTAANYLISQAPGIADPSLPIEWTGESQGDPYLDPFLSYKTAMSGDLEVITGFAEKAKTWKVPPYVAMGYRDLIEETRLVIGGLLTLLFEGNYSSKSERLTELTLLVKAFKPTADINKSFFEVLEILRVLNEVVDLDPTIARSEVVIPHGLASSSSLALWKLFTSVILDVLREEKFIAGGGKSTPLNERVKTLANKYRG